MSLIRRFGVFPILCCLAGSVVAQSAEDILGKAREKYDELSDAELRFTQTVKFPVSGIEQKVTGLLQLKKGNRYRMETEDLVVVTDGETVWSYSRATNQVLIDRFLVDERTWSPEKILTAAPSEFTPTLLGKEKVGNLETHVLRLTPAGEPGYIKSLKLWIAEQDYLTRRVELVDANGKETTYVVSELKVNPGLGDKRFTYAVPEGADVVDLR